MRKIAIAIHGLGNTTRRRLSVSTFWIPRLSHPTSHIRSCRKEENEAKELFTAFRSSRIFDDHLLPSPRLPKSSIYLLLTYPSIPLQKAVSGSVRVGPWKAAWLNVFGECVYYSALEERAWGVWAVEDRQSRMVWRGRRVKRNRLQD